MMYINSATYYIRVSFISLLLIESLRLLKNLFYDKEIKAGLKNLMISASFLIMTVVFLEAVFMFIPRSHGVGHTYASRYWFHKYRGETNEDGYRVSAKEINENSVLFAGDSFTAGHGTKKRENRFSDLFGSKSTKYNAINIGQNGLDTDGEFNAMTKFLAKRDQLPKRIVLQYFGNDIEGVANSNGLIANNEAVYSDLGKIQLALVKGSFMIN